MIKINELKVLKAINENDLAEVKRLIELEIYNTSLSTTDKKRINAFRKFSKQQSNSVRDSMKGAYIDNDNMLTVCNGYVLARLFATDVKDCLMVAEKDIKDNTSKLMHDTKDVSSMQIQLDINDIMLQYKKYKATKDKKITAQNYGIYVISYKNDDGSDCYMNFNIEYLKQFHDIFDFTENIEFYIKSKSSERDFSATVIEDDKSIETLRVNINPLYIESDNGNGLILPIIATKNPKLLMEYNKR